MKVAVVIGHSSKDQGARNSSFDMSEFVINNMIATDIKEYFEKRLKSDHEIVLVYRENGLSKLPGEINALKPDFIVSLHCNAFDKRANGCEMLYYHKSTKGKEIARIFQNNLVQTIDNKDRGIKPKSSEDRGGYLLRYTHAPCIITEPIFIDNDEEFTHFRDLYLDGLITIAYSQSILNAIDYLEKQ